MSATGTGPRSVRGVLRSDAAIDVALAIGAGVFAAAALLVGHDDLDEATAPVWLIVALTAAACLALVVRRRYPLPVALLALVGVLAAAELSDPWPLAPAALVALYSVGREDPSTATLAATLAAVVVTAVIVSALDDRDPFLEELLPTLAILAGPVAVGFGIRQRSERISQRIESEASARVRAERLRIARDLHDVVSHGLSQITVQSGVAARLADSDPALAKRTLEDINATGKASLEELRGMVGVLRSSDEGEDAPLQPAPTDPDDLSALVRRAERDGLEVSTRVDGAFPPDATDGVVIATHRIVGEALANAARHAGPVAVTVTMRHGEEEVVLSVINPRGSGEETSVPSTGVGIEGMSERAATVGGTLTATPTEGGGFLVEARLPYARTTP